ncbi:hypothetical protein L0F63_004748, partial [Massospora cicadina]
MVSILSRGKAIVIYLSKDEADSAKGCMDQRDFSREAFFKKPLSHSFTLNNASQPFAYSPSRSPCAEAVHLIEMAYVGYPVLLAAPLVSVAPHVIVGTAQLGDAVLVLVAAILGAYLVEEDVIVVASATLAPAPQLAHILIPALLLS